METEERTIEGAEVPAPVEETAAGAAENVAAPDPAATVTEEGEATPAPEAPTIDYEALEREDLAALRELFPECESLASLADMKNATRYGALRDMGLTPREAYLATRPTPRVGDNRAHLHSAVPRAASGDRGGMSAAELNAARELFSDLPDTEIRKLYQKVNR